METTKFFFFQKQDRKKSHKEKKKEKRISVQLLCSANSDFSLCFHCSEIIDLKEKKRKTTMEFINREKKQQQTSCIRDVREAETESETVRKNQTKVEEKSSGGRQRRRCGETARRRDKNKWGPLLGCDGCCSSATWD